MQLGKWLGTVFLKPHTETWTTTLERCSVDQLLRPYFYETVLVLSISAESDLRHTENQNLSGNILRIPVDPYIHAYIIQVGPVPSAHQSPGLFSGFEILVQSKLLKFDLRSTMSLVCSCYLRCKII